MKNILLYSLLLLLSAPVVTLAQGRSEFTLELSSAEVQLKPGETKTIDVKIIRSKGFEKYKAKLGFSSALPQGISMKYDSSDGRITSSTLTISADASAQESSYMLLPNCILNNKTKSAVLKVVVKNEGSVTRGE
jgi:hypothetical protein